MAYTLTNLRGLYRAMKNAGITRYKWRFHRGPATFEAIFITEEERFYELLLGAIGTTFALTLKVRLDFAIPSGLETPDFRALCSVLHLTYDPNNHFKPVYFFADLDNAIPQALDLTTGKVKPHHVLAYRRGIDTSDGSYYCGWRDNTPSGNHVQPSNLLKTLAAFGQRVHDFCKAKNISTCWTYDITRAKDFDL